LALYEDCFSSAHPCSAYTGIYLAYTAHSSDTISGSFIVSDSFWIRQDQLADTGVSTLGFNVYYSANTNSLADIVGLEAEILELEFKLSQEGAQK